VDQATLLSPPVESVLLRLDEPALLVEAPELEPDPDSAVFEPFDESDPADSEPLDDVLEPSAVLLPSPEPLVAAAALRLPPRLSVL